MPCIFKVITLVIEHCILTKLLPKKQIAVCAYIDWQVVATELENKIKIFN
jgi:hypothetical protein